jgi:hypothetical protein
VWKSGGYVVRYEDGDLRHFPKDELDACNCYALMQNCAPAHKYFTTTYPNYMQCAGGLQDGATRCAQLLNMLHDLPIEDQDQDDPITFINTDIAAAFQELCRQTTFDTLTGKATKSYDDGRVHPGDDIPTIDALRPFHGVYFKAMRSTACNNRYFDHRGHTHHVKGTTGRATAWR